MPASLESAFDKASATGPSYVIRTLRDQGYDFINQSLNTFVNCLARPGDDDVILINIETDSAPSFYRHCQQNPENPYLPHIKEMEQFSWGTVVRMERLIALDHVVINPQDWEELQEKAPAMIRYVRGESSADEMRAAAMDDPLKEQTVRGLLKVSQDVYRNTGGRILPFCDLKLDNIFLRKTQEGRQLVFGDPLFPGAGNEDDNRAFMEAAYKKFGLPTLDAVAVGMNPPGKNI